VSSKNGWGDKGEASPVTSEVIARVAVAPRDGSTDLSTLLAMSSSNGIGPVELDKSNGAEAEGDGNLLSIGGKVYTRGIGTHGPSQVVYYLGGRCSKLTVDVGIDDEVKEGGAASFKIYADGKLVTDSGVLSAKDGPKTLTAALTGAQLLTLETDPAGARDGDHTDWAAPKILCGKSTKPTANERTLFSFESGTDAFTISNASAGGTVTGSAPFATDGVKGLEVTSPADGNWFGRKLDKPLDLRQSPTLRVDVKTGAQGTSAELAVEVGPASSFCQGGLWTWVNPNATKTIERKLEQLGCPSGVTLDPTQIRAIWVFLKGGTFQLDNIRAE
jgi:alpha-galactosidase